MKKTAALLAGVFAFAMGIGIGLAPTEAKANPCEPCWLGCIGGWEAVCCTPVQHCGCIIIEGQECDIP